MQHHFPRRGLRGTLLGSVSRNQNRSIHQVVEMVVRARDHALRKKHQRSARVRQNLHRAPQRVAIHALAIRSEDHTSELQSLTNLVSRLLLVKNELWKVLRYPNPNIS